MVGHVACMDESQMPKEILFGWLPQWRPAHGTKQQWRDKVRRDMESFGMDESSWFQMASVNRGIYMVLPKNMMGDPPMNEICWPFSESCKSKVSPEDAIFLICDT